MFIVVPFKVVKLCDLATDGDSVTSVQWADKGDLLAVGTNKGITQIWDVHAQKRVCYTISLAREFVTRLLLSLRSERF